MFTCMMLMAGTQLFTKAFSCALCSVVSVKLLFVSVFGEVGLFLFYKLVRGDFLYWLPVHGVFGVVAALIVRIITKIIVDFTGEGGRVAKRRAEDEYVLHDDIRRRYSRS